MRPFRAVHRGLAEIVGTLMLVVIVVAAATAFSFFVQSYQKQLQSEENRAHDKSLEDLRILDLIPTVNNSSVTTPPALADLRLEVASLDVNSIGVNGMSANGQPVVNYTVTNSAGGALGPTECLNGDPLAPANSSCYLTIPAESQVFLDLNLQVGAKAYAFGGSDVILTESGLLKVDTYTSLGNVFVQAFVPPVAIAGVTFVDSYPILDGTASYQPGTNSSVAVSVDQWSWAVTANATANDTGPKSGQEVELGLPFTRGVSYTIQLTVTNSESLIGSTQISYTVA
ncbi:MAG TPA: archaellin/type IV pilin N-terminal domain-containing protein [Thermoplasmata archaeon]|nr:archaellin/type IV pilin N-terminal domain-containing protein [Thermoplasmata archaeon]